MGSGRLRIQRWTTLTRWIDARGPLARTAGPIVGEVWIRHMIGFHIELQISFGRPEVSMSPAPDSPDWIERRMAKQILSEVAL